MLHDFYVAMNCESRNCENSEQERIKKYAARNRRILVRECKGLKISFVLRCVICFEFSSETDFVFYPLRDIKHGNIDNVI